MFYNARAYKAVHKFWGKTHTRKRVNHFIISYNAQGGKKMLHLGFILINIPTVAGHVTDTNTRSKLLDVKREYDGEHYFYKTNPIAII